MPDADRFPPDLPGTAPADWSAAFAALPPVTPPHGGWDRITARLPAPRARAKWPLWLATAASLALVAGLPLTMRQSPDGSDPTPASSAALPPEVAQRDDVPATTAAAVSRVAEAEAGTAIAPGNAPGPEVPGTSTPLASRVDRPDAPARLARAGRNRDDAGAPLSASQVSTLMPPAAGNPLADVQLESARLEALLAMADDERVGSGTGAMLATQMQSRLAGIDSELASGGLDDDARLSLWDARVQTLRELASLEATERWFAAEGREFDTALVQVH